MCDAFASNCNVNLVVLSKEKKFSFKKIKNEYLLKNNLIKEGISKKKIFLTGNTVIDSLNFIKNKFKLKNSNSKLILCTIHRKENQGENFKIFCKKLKIIAKSFQDWKFLFVFHPNPNIKNVAHKQLNTIPNIKLVKSLNYLDFLRYLCKSSIVISDSGGLQEECASLGKFVVIVRESTERLEIISARLGQLNPIKGKKFVNVVKSLINKKIWIDCKSSFCFGRGNSSKKTLNIINKIL
jgi:UDP-N-acetylglucosamine 2-epimerase (non-hydrolysing)